MIYYLDTNALYGIRKIKKENIPYCFTSIMAILELVSGANEKNFEKRKVILSMIGSFNLTIDYAFPEEIIANSFDFFDEYEFVEHRDKALLNLVDAMTASNTFSTYQASEVFNCELGYNYFRELDQNLSKNFADAAIKGIQQIKQYQRAPTEENIISIYDVKFDLNTIDGLKKALPLFSKVATIEAMCYLMVKFCDIPVEIEKVFASYNHLTDVYLHVYSRYADDQVLNSKPPSKNDAQDLLHLLYLKNDFKRFVVSDDKIFAKYFSDNALSPKAISINL